MGARSDRDNFIRGLITIREVDPEWLRFADISASSGSYVNKELNMQRVRTLRDHDTAEGMKHEGDEYVRSIADAEHLAALSVVEILGPLKTEGPGEQASNRASTPTRGKRAKAGVAEDIAVQAAEPAPAEPTE